MLHFCPWSDFPIIGASHSLKTSFLKTDTPESLKNVESHTTSYKNTDCKYFYCLQQFLMNLRILWETCYFAIIASLLHFTASWWKFIQHVKKKKEKVILHLIFQRYLISLLERASTQLWPNQACTHTVPSIKATEQESGN